MWATFHKMPEGVWTFDGFTSHDEIVTEREEMATEEGGVFVAIDLSDYEQELEEMK